MDLKELKANGFGIISFVLVLLNIGIIIFTTFHDFQQAASVDLVFTKQDLYITRFMIISSFIGTILGIIGVHFRRCLYI